MKKYIIGISCIGSGVGQSVINSIKLSSLPIKTVGFGNNPFAYGAYDCDVYDYIPDIYDPGYLDFLIKKYHKHKIDLLIPGLDDEVMIYAENEEKLKKAGVNAIFSKKELVYICRHKNLMIKKLNNFFVNSYEKKDILKNIKQKQIKLPIIAKPLSGSASRGIKIINKLDDLMEINDNNYIFQELAIPLKNDPNYSFFINQIKKGINPQVAEISIQIVCDKKGNLIGRTSTYNKLNNGVPIEVLPLDHPLIDEVINLFVPELVKLGLRGPINIQGRITENGFKIFEINPRFTGITGLRALMGFNEVESCIRSWLKLGDIDQKLVLNQKRFGTRQVADKCIAIIRNKKIEKLSIKLGSKKNNKPFCIFITGANGALGKALIPKLLENNKINIFAYIRNYKKNNYLNELKKDNLYYFNEQDFKLGKINFGEIDMILHLGFARNHHGEEAIANSLEFTIKLFTLACLNQVPSIINISSQSVYGLKNQPPWTEQTRVAPESVYAQAKYASELYLSNLGKINKQLKHTSIRLASIVANLNDDSNTELIFKLCKKSFFGKTINIIDGKQKIERLNVNDAVEGLIKLIYLDSKKWKKIYNFGSGKTFSLLSIAKKIIKLNSKYGSNAKSKLVLVNQSLNINFGMNSSLLFRDLNWTPKHSLEKSIISILKSFKYEK